MPRCRVVNRQRVRFFLLLLFVFAVLFLSPLVVPVPAHKAASRRLGRRSVRFSSRTKRRSSSLSPAAHQAEIRAAANISKRRRDWAKTALPPSSDVTAPLWAYSDAPSRGTLPCSVISVRRDYRFGGSVLQAEGVRASHRCDPERAACEDPND
jgi:hypothetical protein